MQAVRCGCGMAYKKKFVRKRKKFLTNEMRCAKLNQLFAGNKHNEFRKQCLEKSWKNLKKVLTNRMTCANICKSPRVRRQLYLVNWITQKRTKLTPWTINGLFKRCKIEINSQRNSWVIIARSKLFKKWFEPRKRFRYNFLRVWSWLRTNAGGVPNTCKSNGVILRGHLVANGWVTREKPASQWGTTVGNDC